MRVRGKVTGHLAKVEGTRDCYEIGDGRGDDFAPELALDLAKRFQGEVVR